MDNSSFENIFKSNYKSLCFYAQNFIQDMDAIEDIIHDIFIKLWEKRDQVEQEKSIKSYLYRSVHNRCLNYIRDNKKFVESSENIDNLHTTTEDVNTDEIEKNELEVRIQSALQSLPEKCREVFELSRFQEMKYAEIAEHLNISVKTVENQISKALKILREKLGDYLINIIVIALFYIFLIQGIGVTHFSCVLLYA